MRVEGALYTGVIQSICDSHLAPEPVEGSSITEDHLMRTLQHHVPACPVAGAVHLAERAGPNPLDDLKRV